MPRSDWFFLLFQFLDLVFGGEHGYIKIIYIEMKGRAGIE